LRLLSGGVDFELLHELQPQAQLRSAQLVSPLQPRRSAWVPLHCDPRSAAPQWSLVKLLALALPLLETATEPQ
jgi:hypothetical protein